MLTRPTQIGFLEVAREWLAADLIAESESNQYKTCITLLPPSSQDMVLDLPGHCKLLLEMPTREEASPVSEDPEPLGLTHIGHLRVREGVNCPCLKALLCGSWDHHPSAA